MTAVKQERRVATNKTDMNQAEDDIAVEKELKQTGLLGSEANDLVVPIIDLSFGTEEEVRSKLWTAATEVGFFTVDLELLPAGASIQNAAIEANVRTGPSYCRST